MKTLETTANAVARPVEVPDALLPGAKAGPWVVERELGRGGMGVVYGVVHEEIGKRAALKIIHTRLLGPGFNADRMLLEAKVVNQIGHPNIVDIFETGHLPDGRPYIVMERLEGEPLSVRADASKLMPDQVIAILLQICDALVAAHAAGVIHRDLKLDNIFLSERAEEPQNPHVKLLDWGIAKLVNHDVKHTIDGQLVGTPQYLSPEQARGADVTPATDVYSLGVMAYELFLETLPFEAETSAEIMAMHLRCVPPPPSELWPDIPARLEALILAMLSKQPAQRPAVEEVARELAIVRLDVIRRRQTRAPTTKDSLPLSIVLEEPDELVLATQLPAMQVPAIQVSAIQVPAMPVPAMIELPRVAARMARFASAPTMPAGRATTKRWQYAVGGFAIAAIAGLFLLSHAGDSAAAGTLASDTAAAKIAPAPVAVTPPNSIESMPIASVTPAPQRVERSRPIATPRTSTKSRPSSTRTAPATPRRATKIDPDGTFDPYR